VQTLRKADIIANLTMRAAEGNLKTNARFNEIYGNWFAFAIEIMREHWLFTLIGVFGGIASIVALLIVFFSK
jgi:hypothetical protein